MPPSMGVTLLVKRSKLWINFSRMVRCAVRQVNQMKTNGNFSHLILIENGGVRKGSRLVRCSNISGLSADHPPVMTLNGNGYVNFFVFLPQRTIWTVRATRRSCGSGWVTTGNGPARTYGASSRPKCTGKVCWPWNRWSSVTCRWYWRSPSRTFSRTRCWCRGRVGNIPGCMGTTWYSTRWIRWRM